MNRKAIENSLQSQNSPKRSPQIPHKKPELFIFDNSSPVYTESHSRAVMLGAMEPLGSVTNKGTRSANYEAWVPMTPQGRGRVSMQHTRGLPPDFAETVLDLEMLIDQPNVDLSVITRLNQLYVVRTVNYLDLTGLGASSKQLSTTRQ